MTTSKLVTIVALLVAAPAVAAAAATDAAFAYGSETAAQDPAEVEPFARLRHLEPTGDGVAGAEALRADGYREEVFFNSPLFRGDRLRTDAAQRAELQLPDGTLLRLGRDGLLELVTIHDPSSRFDRASLLALHRGSLQVDLPFVEDELEAFRVDTFACSVYPIESSAFRIDITPGGEVLVTVSSGAVEVVSDEGAVVVEAGHRTAVREGHAPQYPRRHSLFAKDGFDQWVASRDEALALRGRPGEEYESLPEEVRPYYGELSRNGRWVWVDDYGYTWSPEVPADWRPYYDGYWGYGAGGPVWISYEPWGWATYRYGRWDFVSSVGWVWIPGRVWSGAWVAWHYGPSYVGWCPIDYWGYPVYLGVGFSWGHPYYDHYPWSFVHHRHYYYHDVTQVVVRRKHFRRDDLNNGRVVRRPARVRRGGDTSDAARRVARSPRSFDAVDRDERKVRQVARRDMRETEREILGRRTVGRGAASGTDGRSVSRRASEDRAADRRSVGRGASSDTDSRSVSRRASEDRAADRRSVGRADRTVGERTATDRRREAGDAQARRAPTRDSASGSADRSDTGDRPGIDVRRPTRAGRAEAGGKADAPVRRPTTTERDAVTARRHTSGGRADRDTRGRPTGAERSSGSSGSDSSRERLRRLFREANRGRSATADGSARSRPSRSPTSTRSRSGSTSRPPSSARSRSGSTSRTPPSAGSTRRGGSRPSASPPSRSPSSGGSKGSTPRARSGGRSPGKSSAGRSSSGRSGSRSSGSSSRSGGRSSGRSRSSGKKK